jgi:hypothetical protein
MRNLSALWRGSAGRVDRSYLENVNVKVSLKNVHYANFSPHMEHLGGSSRCLSIISVPQKKHRQILHLEQYQLAPLMRLPHASQGLVKQVSDISRSAILVLARLNKK